MRLQKYLAQSGVASRRAAEKLIAEGHVTVNGEKITQMGVQVEENDRVAVDGKVVHLEEEKHYLLYYKPIGEVTTVQDPEGRPTVLDKFRDYPVRLVPAGRLDFDSEGLLLLTNDGDVIQRVLHPSHEVNKTYHVQVYGPVAGAAEKLSAIRDLRGEPIRPANVRCLWQGEKTAELEITIHEGKNRQIRRMCARCDLGVKRLRRVREHTLELGDLPPGKWRYLTEQEIAELKGL